MTTPFRYDRFESADADAHDSLLRQAFASPAQDSCRFRALFGPDAIRLVRAGPETAAALALIEMGQWYGGRAVPCTGIAGLAVAPPFRGRGLSTFMLVELFGETKARGLPLVTLYPSTLPAYRKAGFEIAGRRIIYAADTDRVVPAGSEPPDLRRIAVSDRSTLERIVAAEAATEAGLPARSPSLWSSRLEPPGRPVDGYLIEGSDGPEGYLIIEYESKQLRVGDWCATTGRAARQILATLAGHRSTFPEAIWEGAPTDMLTAQLPEKGWRIRHQEEWMTRIVDVEAALAARGYPAGLTSEVAFDVADDLLPWNRGRFVLRVADGRGTVIRDGGGAAPALALDVRALAPLYTGHHTPAFLARAGRIEGPAAAVAAAALVFAGARPWMRDHF